MMKKIYDLDQELIPLKKRRDLLRRALFDSLDEHSISKTAYKELILSTSERVRTVSPEMVNELRSVLTGSEYESVVKERVLISKLRKLYENITAADNRAKVISKILKKKPGQRHSLYLLTAL